MTLRTPCYVLSDAHLGVASPDVESTLLAFFEATRGDAGSYVVNGDLFDFWFEWRHVMPRTGFRTIAALAAARAAGAGVLWIAGNHDCWGGEILRHDVGVEYHVGPWRGRIGAWETLIEHGDGLRDVEDAPYRRLRAVLRNPVAIWAFRHLLHPDWATAIARASSHTSRGKRPRDGGVGLRRVAESRLSGPGAPALYVYGHSHTAALERLESGGVAANPGAWLDAPQALRIRDDDIALVRLDGTAVTAQATLGRVSG